MRICPILMPMLPAHLRRSALALTGFVTSNLADEFHPEIHKLARKFHLPY